MTWWNKHWRQINATSSVCMMVLAVYYNNADAMLPTVGWLLSALELMRPRL